MPALRPKRPARKPKRPARTRAPRPRLPDRLPIEAVEKLVRKAEATHNRVHREEIVARLAQEMVLTRPAEEKRQLLQFMKELKRPVRRPLRRA